MGVDDKDRDLKKGKKAAQRASGLGCTQDKKNTARNSSDVEKYVAQTIERTPSPLFKIMITALAVCALILLFAMAAMGAEKCYLTPNFSFHEFTRKCHDTLPTALRPNLNELTKNLQVIRNHIHQPIIVISGYRSLRCNARVKGAAKSQHMHAKAADIVVKNMAHRDLQKAILKLIHEGKISDGGVGLYRTHVHYDIRGSRSRWHKIVDKFIHVFERFSDEGG